MKGCMLIHGFTGSPHEVMPLAEHLKRHTDWLIHTPTLPGHGARESLKDINWQDWVTFAERECGRIIRQCTGLNLVGFSMGSLIAAYLANRFPVSKLVLLSPAVFAPNPQQIIRDVADLLREGWEDNGAMISTLERYKTKITQTPLRAVLQFRKMVRTLTPVINKVDVPVLIIHGKKDDLADPRSADYVYQQVKSPSKDIVWLEKSKHVICHDCEQEQVIRKVSQFFDIPTA
ncbi:carboxylesterase precursor [Caldalkalibacillus thermarum TA2.A1]|uniref:Alpha/beta fold hydrolase n=1 Tax=Caldalkalibacillus thermarum (strain TA2.A1) TaxID=986075 RepID=F5L4H3_CALTT|nr:alpha/beta fold hydrolase [Caldalkalibacillus thermarum]EGL83753.1 carboxylesterase precursor [Caldalkalibacillus thermarum TA2.A1]QZT33864.1 alpha/beta fold hydrolase [Caldalkalibacillus thermarum TA2.A1]